MIETVVVIDDDATLRDAIVDALADAGFATLTAGDGAEALHVLRVVPRPCVALVDLIMPRVDGWSLLAAIAREPALADIRVLCITAGREPPPPSCDAVLKKPFNEEQLLAVMRDLFARG